MTCARKPDIFHISLNITRFANQVGKQKEKKLESIGLKLIGIEEDLKGGRVDENLNRARVSLPEGYTGFYVVIPVCDSEDVIIPIASKDSTEESSDALRIVMSDLSLGLDITSSKMEFALAFKEIMERLQQANADLLVFPWPRGTEWYDLNMTMEAINHVIACQSGHGCGCCH